MDSSGMRKRVGLILERCGADLEKLIREDSENGQSCRAASQACSAVRHLRRYQASLKGKAAKRRYEASPKGKATLALRTARRASAERGPRRGVVSSDVSGGLSDVVGEPLVRLAVWGARGVTCMAPSSVQENKNKNGSGASQHHLPTYLPIYLPAYRP